MLFWKKYVTSNCQPNWKNDIPLCDAVVCEQFDGKRCKLLGFQPSRVCEPIVKKMAKVLDEAD